MLKNIVDLKELKSFRLSLRIHLFLNYFKNYSFFILMLNSYNIEERSFFHQLKSPVKIKKISSKILSILFYLSKFKFLKNLLKGNLFFYFIDDKVFFNKDFLNSLSTWNQSLFHFFYFKSNLYRLKSLNNFFKKSFFDQTLISSFFFLYFLFFTLINII